MVVRKSEVRNKQSRVEALFLHISFLWKVFQSPPETQGKDAVENKRSVNKSVVYICVWVVVVMASCLSEKLNCYLYNSLASFVYTAHSLGAIG